MTKEMYMQQLEILGTTVELRLVGDTKSPIEQWFSVLWQEIYTFQNNFSRFIPTSELSMFNQRAGEQVFITKEFHALLSVSAQYQKLSSGLFNPFILPALQRAGYVQSLLANDSAADDYSSVPITMDSNRIVILR